MIAEKIDADSQGRHTAKEGGVGHLAVLEGVAMIRVGVLTQGLFNGINSDLRSLITIGVDMNVGSAAVVDGNPFAQFGWGDIPHPVRSTIEIARPT